MARPTKLTDELTDVLCENIELGMPYKLACQAAGINYDTFNEWMKKGAEGSNKKFIEFSDQVRASEAECAKRNLDNLRKAADNGSVASSMWLLERRYPDEFGKRDKIDMKNEHSGNIQINLSVQDCGEDV